MLLDRIDAFLFDMDGTLVDSDAAVERAWVAWAVRYDVDAETALSIAHGSPADTTARILRPDLDDDEVSEAAAFQLAMQYDDLHDVVPTVGALELIDVLGEFGVKWAVVTSADLRLATARLGAVQIEPEVLVTVDDVARGKPDPEGYLTAAKALGVLPGRCLVVEDSTAGVMAGQSSGALVAAVKGLEADVSLNDLAELAELVTGPSGL